MVRCGEDVGLASISTYHRLHREELQSTNTENVGHISILINLNVERRTNDIHFYFTMVFGLSWENTGCGESMDCDDEPFLLGPLSHLKCRQ